MTITERAGADRVGTGTDVVDAHLAALVAAAQLTSALAPTIRDWGEQLAHCFESGGQLLACGNGGSAAEAQHLTGELVGRFRHERRALPAIALGADAASTTSIVNDYGSEEMFARQVRAFGRPGDVLVALSTSGTSPNVVAAAKAALEIGVTVWALTGPAPNSLASVSDSAISVDAATTATVQELHLCVVHALCAALDDRLGASR